MLRGAHRAFRKLPRNKASVNRWHLHFAQLVQQTTGLGRCHLSSTGAQCARDGDGTDARGHVIGRKQLRRRPLNRIRRGKVGLAIREKSTMCRPNIHRIRRFRRRSWGRNRHAPRMGIGRGEPGTKFLVILLQRFRVQTRMRLQTIGLGIGTLSSPSATPRRGA